MLSGYGTTHDTHVVRLNVATLQNAENRHGPLHAGHPSGLTIVGGPREAGHDGYLGIFSIFKRGNNRSLDALKQPSPPALKSLDKTDTPWRNGCTIETKLGKFQDDGDEFGFARNRHGLLRADPLPLAICALGPNV
jgi:hypothetical protein